MRKNSGLNCLIVNSSQRYVSYINHILNLLEECLVNEGYHPIFLKDEIKPGQDYLEQIKSLINDSVLGVVILDGFRPNVILEFGMLLSLDKCILVLKGNKAKISVKNLYNQSSNPQDFDSNLTEVQFKRLIDPYINIEHHLSDYAGKHIVYYEFHDVKEIKETIRSNIKKISKCVENYINKEHLEAERLNDLDILLKLDLDKVDYLIRDNRFTHALGTLDRIWEQYKDSNYRYYKYLYKRGDTLQKMGRYEEALEAYRNVIEIGTNKKQIMIIYYNLGLLYLKRSNYTSALSSLEEALKIAETTGESQSEANIFNELGNLSLKQSNLEEAKYYFNKTDRILVDLLNGSKNRSERYSTLTQIQTLKSSQINLLHQYYKKLDSEYEKKKKNKIFISYASADSKRLKIPDIIKTLEGLSEELEIDYWEKYHENDEIKELLVENIATADLVIVIFSKDAVHSTEVNTELNFSSRMQKQILPVFEEGVEIPYFLVDKKVLKYDPKNYESFSKHLYKIIIEKIKK